MAWLLAARNLIVPIVLAFLIATQAYDVYDRDREGGDFAVSIWNPASAVLEGTSPYVDSVVGIGEVAVYPPLIFVLAIPLALLEFGLATVLWQAILVGAAAAALAVLGVRDWRCYAVWLTSCPVVLCVLYGNATLALVPLVALTWRYRDRAAAAAACLTACVVFKLFLAPVLLWFLFTRRYRAALYTALAVPPLVFVPWAGLRFDGLTAYPRHLAELANELGPNGVLVQALARQLGADRPLALVVGLAVAGCLLVAGWMRRDDDLVSFTCALAAALALTPIAWIYYVGLLVVPLAIVRPTFTRAWWLVAAFWVSWVNSPLGWATWQLSVAVLAISSALLLTVTRPTPARRGTPVWRRLAGTLSPS